MDLNLDFSNPKTAIVNIVIILFLVLAVYDGYKKGFFESLFKFLGFVIACMFAFILKNKLSVVMYTYLPFFKFGGAFKGIKALNILLYELLAFIIIFIIIMIVVSLVLKMTHVIEKIIKAIPLVGFIDRCLGAIVGFVQSILVLYLVIFAFKFGSNLFGFSMHDSLADNILEIPILKEKFGGSLTAFDDIVELKKSYKSDDKEEFNNMAIDVLLNRKVITRENLDVLIKKGKITYKDKNKVSYTEKQKDQ